MANINSRLHVFKINNGIYLDTFKLKGVREYTLEHKENENAATMIIKMDVRILDPKLNSKGNSFFNQSRDGIDGGSD